MNFKSIKTKVVNFAKTPAGKSTLKWSRRVFLWFIIGWLFYQLTDIGWLNVWRSLPVSPTFYLLFIIVYFSLPAFEILIYRITWDFHILDSIPVFILKKVYNKDVLGYSGEVYFYLWARKKLHLKDSEILKTIKDNNIISSIASTLISLGLLSIFLFTDQIRIMDWIANQNQVYIYGGAILIIVTVAMFIRFRHFVISMPMKTAFTIFGIQNFRLLLGQTINLLMYMVVIPQTPVHVWFTLMSVEIILSRIPFLPNRDLIFVGMGIGLSTGLHVPQTELAALLVVKGVLNKIGNFIFFSLTSMLKRTSAIPVPETDGQDLDPSKLSPTEESYEQEEKTVK